MILEKSRINCYNSSALEINNNSGFVQVYNSFLNGAVNCNNSITGMKLVTSRVNAPLDVKMKIENSQIQVLSNSHINVPIEVKNLSSHSVNFRKSTFYKEVNLEKIYGKSTIRENVFKVGISMWNTKDVDLTNNDFEGSFGVKINGAESVNSLLFNNRFNNSLNGIENRNLASETKVECNSFLTQGTADLYLAEPIALSQGNENLAAGNSFSRAQLEVFAMMKLQ